MMGSTQSNLIEKAFNDNYSLLCDTYWQYRSDEIFLLMFYIADADGEPIVNIEDHGIKGGEKMSDKQLLKIAQPIFNKYYKKYFAKYSKRK
jgi:hypothetical protein